jgi:hypothetical protein
VCDIVKPDPLAGHAVANPRDARRGAVSNGKRGADVFERTRPGRWLFHLERPSRVQHGRYETLRECVEIVSRLQHHP